MKTLNPEILTQEQKHFIAYAVGAFGCGQHPCVGADNLQFVGADYARECVRAARQSNRLSLQGKEVATTLLLEVL
jgi:hypothetical protein